MAFKDKEKELSYIAQYQKENYDRITVMAPKGTKDDIKNLNDRLQKAKEEAITLKKRIAILEDDSIPENFVNKLKQSSLLFAGKVANFLEDIGGYVWLTDYFDQIPDFERQSYVSSVEALKAWIGAMDFNMNKKKGE